MSDTMERDKNEQLIAREIEEEEMKRVLTGIGIYEPGSTYKEMKKLLGFLNESKDTSNITSDNKNTQKGNMQHSDNECLSKMTSETDASQEMVAQEHVEIPRPTYSQKLNRTSPTVTHERKTARYSSSPEPPTYEIRNSAYRRKSPDSDETSEKQNENANCAHSTNRFRSANVPRECQNATEMRTAGQGEHNQRLDRWRLNPLDIYVNENDVPLQQPDRSPVRERMPFGCCKEAHTSEQRDQVMRALSQHLKDMADLWYSWHCPTDSKFQWGSPIQVGTANGSLDRKPFTDPKTEPIKTECIYTDERASKRKASSLIAHLNRESSTEDEDDQYDFARVKKKRIQSENKSSNIDRTNQHTRASRLEKTTSDVITHQQRSFNDDNRNTDFDNEDNKSPGLLQRRNDESGKLSPELAVYPRRIIPPNPKARLGLSRQKRGNVKSKSFQNVRCTDEDVEQVKNKKKGNILTDEKIRRKLEENSDEEETAATARKNIEFHPLTKEIDKRLQEKQLSSNNTEIARETRSMSKERESDGQRKKEKKTELGEQHKKEEKLYKVENKNISWEHQLLSSDNEDELFEMNQGSDIQNGNQCDVSTSTTNISCPICNKLFPRDEIEDHAADCEQFETNDEDCNNADQFECNICNNYKTDNGVEYENHVHHCINSKNDERHSCGSKDIDINIVSTSSFRTYKPKSEQKEKKKKIIMSKKRKH